MKCGLEKIIIKRIKNLSSSIKKYGAKATLQLSHVGPQGNTIYNDQEVVGSSEIVPDIKIKARPLKYMK